MNFVWNSHLVLPLLWKCFQNIEEALFAEEALLCKVWFTIHRLIIKLVSSEVFLRLCQTSLIKLFRKANLVCLTLTVFDLKLYHRCFTGTSVPLSIAWSHIYKFWIFVTCHITYSFGSCSIVGKPLCYYASDRIIPGLWVIGSEGCCHQPPLVVWPTAKYLRSRVGRSHTCQLSWRNLGSDVHS